MTRLPRWKIYDVTGPARCRLRTAARLVHMLEHQHLFLIFSRTFSRLCCRSRPGPPSHALHDEAEVAHRAAVGRDAHGVVEADLPPSERDGARSTASDPICISSSSNAGRIVAYVFLRSSCSSLELDPRRAAWTRAATRALPLRAACRRSA